jgi:hypothetical protein
MTAQPRLVSAPVHLATWLAAALALAALIGLQALPARAGGTVQVLYGADGAGGNPATNLYILDPTTGGIVTTVGPIGFAVTGLATHPTTGILYATTANASPTSPGALIAINTTTGAGVLIGDLHPTNQTAADITFGADGTLYGWLEANDDDLVTIDLTTGAATIVGNAGLSTAGGGLAGSSNPLLLFGEGDGGCMDTIDTGTGAATTCVATLDGTADWQIPAADHNAGGTLYAVRMDDAGGSNPRPAELITIDTTTGAVTVIGDTVDRLDAIAFGPAAAAPSVVPSVPNAATTQPSGMPGSTGALAALGLLMGIAALGLIAVRSVMTARRR